MFRGANRKVTRNSDFFRLKTSPITSIRRFSWFEPNRGFSGFSAFLVGDYTCDFLFVPRVCQELFKTLRFHDFNIIKLRVNWRKI